MARYIASLFATVSLAAIPAVVLAAPIAGGHDCTQSCECAHGATKASAPKTEKKATAARADEPSEFQKSVWTSP